MVMARATRNDGGIKAPHHPVMRPAHSQAKESAMLVTQIDHTRLKSLPLLARYSDGTRVCSIDQHALWRARRNPNDGACLCLASAA